MEIYLIRHTAPNIEKGICYGQTDLDVADTFQEECGIIHKNVIFNSTTKVYSSPLLRCKKLAKTFSSEIQYDERLMELDFGAWEMQEWDTIPDDQLTPWMKDFVNVQVPQGESYTFLQKRVLDFFNTCFSDIHEKKIIVTHAGVIRSLIADLKGIPLKDSFSIQLNYGHVLRLENKGTTFAVTEGLIIK